MQKKKRSAPKTKKKKKNKKKLSPSLGKKGKARMDGHEIFLKS